ncbi:MAG: serine protease [Acidobacteriaceae bacterium]
MKLVSLALGMVMAVAAAAQTPARVLESTRNAVFRVDSVGCIGGNRSATGFLWNGSTLIVTSLHVVAGCQTFSVYSETQGRSIQADVSKSLGSADLALLKLHESVRFANPLTLRAVKPSAHETLTALGYPLLVPKMDSTDVIVKFGGGTLGEIVPEQTRKELAQRNSPSVDLQITDFQGSLLSGLSGAPILDARGEVVAIGDGGLENGTVGRSWGVPVSYLAQLMASNERPTALQGDPHLFAAETEVHPGGETVQCGSGSFTKARTIGFNEIMHSTDDPARLTQMVNLGFYSGIDASRFSYDIYQSPTGGAAFAVPAGARVQPVESGDRAGCVVYVRPGIDMQIQMQPMRGPGDMNGASYRYENLSTPVSTYTGYVAPNTWLLNPAYTFRELAPSLDGHMVNRKFILHYVPNPQNAYMPAVTDQAAFETIAGKGNTFIGTTAFNRAFNPQADQWVNYCHQYPNAQNCAQVREYQSLWAETMLAAFLTTFSQ